MNNYPNPEYKCLLKLIKQHCNFIYCTDKTMVTFGIDKITFQNEHHGYKLWMYRLIQLHTHYLFVDQYIIIQVNLSCWFIFS